MNLQDITRSPFTNATKSRMLLDYCNILDDSDKIYEKAYHYYRCYEALAIIQILERECQRVNSSMAKSLSLFREDYFTAWASEEMIYQWDDTNAEEFLENPEGFPFCIDKRFSRWWVYPKHLLERPELPNPVSASAEALVDLEPRPILFSAPILLNCLEHDLKVASDLVQYSLTKSKSG